MEIGFGSQSSDETASNKKGNALQYFLDSEPIIAFMSQRNRVLSVAILVITSVVGVAQQDLPDAGKSADFQPPITRRSKRTQNGLSNRMWRCV